MIRIEPRLYCCSYHLVPNEVSFWEMTIIEQAFWRERERERLYLSPETRDGLREIFLGYTSRASSDLSLENNFSRRPRAERDFFLSCIIQEILPWYLSIITDRSLHQIDWSRYWLIVCIINGQVDQYNKKQYNAWWPRLWLCDVQWKWRLPWNNYRTSRIHGFGAAQAASEIDVGVHRAK